MAILKPGAFAQWQNPITSIASLLAGLILAIGHHFFYVYLNDKLVISQPYIVRQWSVSIGTGFAFLTHSAFSVSIGITFWQFFWSTLHRKSMKLSTIDSLADSWSSLLELLNQQVIKASPLLVLLALTATVINPIAVVFPPGTLRVRIQPRNATFYNQTISVPTWDDPTPFALHSTKDGHYLGPTRRLMRGSAAAAYQMNLPDLPKIVGVPNATYELQMFTPTVQCDNTEVDMLSNFTAIFDCTEGPFSTCGNRQNIYSYLAWVPLCNGTHCAANTHTDIAFNGSMPAYVRNVGTPGYGPAQMYISTLHRSPATTWNDTSNWQTLNCSLYNASQIATFVFNNADSYAHFDRSRMEILNPVTLAENDLIANSSKVEQSYLALMDTLGGLLAGTILWKHEFEEWLVRDTVVLDSKLAESAEMSQWAALTDNQIQWEISSYDDTKPALKDIIEELFHNMTLSLFAMGEFTEPKVLPAVHSDWYANHFEYSPRNLLLAYGIALFLTTIIAVLGYVSVLKDGKSFSNRLSTVIRTMQNDELNAVIEDEHRGGEDPLPEHLAKTKVQISRPRTVSFAIPTDDAHRNYAAKEPYITEIKG